MFLQQSRLILLHAATMPRNVTLEEDSQAIVDLLQGASDVDGDTLTVNVTCAPTCVR